MKARPVIFTVSAEAELLTAVSYYETVQTGLGLTLAHRVRLRTQMIARSPHTFPKWKYRSRFITIYRYPYAMLYHIGRNVITVFGLSIQGVTRNTGRDSGPRCNADRVQIMEC